MRWRADTEGRYPLLNAAFDIAGKNIADESSLVEAINAGIGLIDKRKRTQ
ncbi:hypothetical protein [Bacillus sp. FJAT-50079]|nr:hypothetical protein [Bacillus sp. FJAT-50079]MBS4208104.1 hypothetical protein [Bacillus sp. FJAT-50079]